MLVLQIVEADFLSWQMWKCPIIGKQGQLLQTVLDKECLQSKMIFCKKKG